MLVKKDIEIQPQFVPYTVALTSSNHLH